MCDLDWFSKIQSHMLTVDIYTFQGVWCTLTFLVIYLVLYTTFMFITCNNQALKYNLTFMCTTVHVYKVQ